MRTVLLAASLLFFLSSLVLADDIPAWEKEARRTRELGMDHLAKGDWVPANKMWKETLDSVQKRLDRKELKRDDLSQPQARLMLELSLRLMHIANWRNDDSDEKSY